MGKKKRAAPVFGIPGAVLSAKAKANREKRGLSHLNPNFVRHEAVRKVGLKAIKDGTHPQMWRARQHGGAGAKLGAMGGLGEDIILEVLFNIGKIPYADRKHYARFVRMIERTFQGDVHEPLYKYAEGKVLSWVPEDTGRLRDTLMSRLKAASATVQDMSAGNKPYRMTIGTEMQYAAVVNKMPTSWLKHTTARAGLSYRVFRGGKPGNLLDPEAKSKWYDLTLLNSRNLAQRLIRDWLKNTIVPLIKEIGKYVQIPNPSAVARSFFTVKYK